MSAYRLIFMGTPAFAVPTLQALRQGGHEICAIYTQPPRPAGRGYQETLSAVHQAAGNIPVFTPLTLKDSLEQDRFQSFQADLAVVVAYGLILPKAILDAPRWGCINVHASLLPRWRGASPIQQALLAGDSETGITMMKMEEGLDTGPILMQKAVSITSTTTTPQLHDDLAQLGAEMIGPALEGLILGQLTPTPQPEAGVTYAPKLTREDGRLHWEKPATVLDRQIRALNPWPGTFFFWKDIPVKVLQAQLSLTPHREKPGTLLSPSLRVACGEAALTLERVQIPGKKPMTGLDFMNGYGLKVGQSL